MKPKKSEKADVDRFDGIFFKTGLICSILMVVFAFSWQSKNHSFNISANNMINSETDELPDITWQKPHQPLHFQNPELKIVSHEVLFDSNQQNLFRTDFDPTDSIIFTFPDDSAEVDYNPYAFIPLEKRPEFPGGETELARYLKANITYPEPEKTYQVQGTVVIAFVVEKDGSLSDIHIVKSVSPNIDEEAIRVVRAMPKWNPGIQRDRAVKAGVSLPLRFVIAK